MLVDISRSCKDSPCERVIKMQGDEASLLPPLLAKTLKASLQLGKTPRILYRVLQKPYTTFEELQKVMRVNREKMFLFPHCYLYFIPGPPITSNAASDEHARKTRNVLVAEAFLRFFVELLGDYRSFFKEGTGEVEFDVRNQIKYLSSHFHMQ